MKQPRLLVSKNAADQLKRAPKEPVDPLAKDEERAAKQKAKAEEKAARAEAAGAALREAKEAEAVLREAMVRFEAAQPDVIAAREREAQQYELAADEYRATIGRLRRLIKNHEIAEKTARAKAAGAQQEAEAGRASLQDAGTVLPEAYTGFVQKWAKINPKKRRKALWDNDLRKAARDIIGSMPKDVGTA